MWCHEIKNFRDKYAITVQRNGAEVVRHLPLGNSRKFAKAILYFLKIDKKHSCRMNLLDKVANAGNRTIPPWTIAPETTAPRTNATLDNCLPENSLSKIWPPHNSQLGKLPQIIAPGQFPPRIIDPQDR